MSEEGLSFLYAIRAKGKEIAQFVVQSKQNANPKRAVQFVVRVVYHELRKAGLTQAQCMDIAVCIMDEIANDIGREVKAQEQIQEDQFKREADEEYQRAISGELAPKPERI